MRYLVFTYGTLMQNEPNNDVLGSAAVFCGTDHTASVFMLLHLGGFPAVVPAGACDGCAVAGEVFSVDSETLANLDRLEGVPYLYTRETITLESGRTAYIYILNSDRAHGRHEVIASGDWRQAA